MEKKKKVPQVPPLAGMTPLGIRPKLVHVCAWCPDKEEQTASARAHGFDVSHGICESCRQGLFPEVKV